MKKLINKNVIKAMTIGISALMVANSMNLTAFAAEGDPVTDPTTAGTDGNATTTAPGTVQTQSELSQALDAAGTQADVVNEVVSNSDNSNPGVEQKIEEVIEKAEAKEIKKETAGFTADLKNAFEDPKDGDDLVDITNDSNVVDGDIDNIVNGQYENPTGLSEDIQTAIDLMSDPTLSAVIDGSEKALDGVVDDADKNAQNGNDLADQANQIVGIGEEDGIDALIESTRNAIDEANNRIRVAGTVQEAQEAAQDANDAVETFNNVVNSKLTAFNALAEQFQNAVDREKELNDLADKLYAQYTAAVNKFNGLQDTASKDAQDTKAEIDDLAEKIAAVKDLAKKNMNVKLDAGQELVSNQEFLVNNKSNRDFAKDTRPLAMLIVDNYIIPEIYKGEVVEGSGQYHDQYDKKEYDATISNKDVLDYYEVQYIPEGETEPVTLRIGYKGINNNKIAGNSYQGIVIFEKTEYTLVEGKELTQTELNDLDKAVIGTDDDGNEILGDGIVEKTINDVNYIITKNANGEIECYKASDFTNTVIEVSEEPVEENGVTTETDINEDTIQTTYYYEDGKFVKQETAEVTTTKYTGVTLNGVDKDVRDSALSSENAAKDAFALALNGIIAGLGDKTIEITVGNQTKTISSTDVVTRANCTLYGFVSTNKEYEDEDQSVLAAQDGVETTDVAAKISFVNALNTFITNNIKTSDVRYEIKVTDKDGNVTTKELTSTTKITVDDAEAYGFKVVEVTEPVSDSADHIDALSEKQKTENESKQAYIDAIDEIRKDFAENQFIEIQTGVNSTVRIYKNTRITIENVESWGYVADNKTDNQDVISYTVTGNYIKTFTKTVNANDGYAWHRQEAKEDGYNKAIAPYKYNDGNGWDSAQQRYTLIGTPSDKDVTYYSDTWGCYSHGTVTLEYAELSSITLNNYYAVIKDVVSLVSRKDQEAAAEAALDEKYAKEGKIFVDIDGYQGLFNGGFGKAKVYYVNTTELNQTVNVEDLQTKEDGTKETALEAVKRIIESENAGNKGKVNARNLNAEATAVYSDPYTTYGYARVDFAIKTALYGYEKLDGDLYTTKYGYNAVTGTEIDVNTENKVILKQTNEGTPTTSTTEFRNDNWYTGNIILAEYVNNGKYTNDGWDWDKNPETTTTRTITLSKEDKERTEAFRKWADKGIKKIEYTNLYNAADAAEGKIGAAQKEIVDLQTKISALKRQLKEYELAGITGDISASRTALLNAIELREIFEGLLGEVNENRDNRIVSLLPEATTYDGGAAVGGVGAPVFGAPGAAIGGGAPAVVDGDGGAAVDDGGAPVITEEIGDEDAALAETIPTDEKKIYDIIDDPTALAELIEEPGVHIGWWWWLLIIAALGATGYALYRKYKKNKAAEANGGKKDQK